MRVVALLLTLAALCGGCAPPSEPAAAGTDPTPRRWSPEREFLLGGIQVNEPDLGDWLDALGEQGFNTISLTVYARHGRWDSDQIEDRSEPDSLVPEIRAARARGLRVVLIVRVALEHALTENAFLWHGMIMPRTDDQVRTWFGSYGEYLRRWAETSEREGVDVLGIGSELNALASTSQVAELPALEEYYLNLEKQERERQRALRSAEALPAGALDGQLKAGWGESYDDLGRFLNERTRAQHAWAVQVTSGGDLAAFNQRRALLLEEWRGLIASVREIYGGRLTYAANFDQYKVVGFWGDLDLIGINAYFPLRKTLAASGEAELAPLFEEAWGRILGEIDVVRRGLGRPDLPVVFTELGYTTWDGATVEPWAGAGFGVVGEEDDPRMLLWPKRPRASLERALAVRALEQAARSRGGDLLRGLLYWKLSTLPEHREIEPFVLVLGSDDPLLPELLRFRQQSVAP